MSKILVASLHGLFSGTERHVVVVSFGELNHELAVLFLKSLELIDSESKVSVRLLCFVKLPLGILEIMHVPILSA
jgi:hypothetical protein